MTNRMDKVTYFAYYADHMTAHVDTTSVLDRQLLQQLGERLKRLRKLRKLSSVTMAHDVGISRTTLASVEAGEPAPSMGTYLRVMSALGVSGELALLGSGVLQPDLSSTRKPVRRATPPISVTVKATAQAHDVQDLQSLMLHQEAVRLMRSNPALIVQAQETLERWRQSPNPHAQFLWDEWSVILHRRDWRRALSRTRRGKELRQASPLPGVLPVDVRADVLAQVSALKKGVRLGSLPGEGHEDLEPPTP